MPIVDIITDADTDLNVDIAPLPVTRTESDIEKGIIRTETGQFVKGTRNPNAGRPKKIKSLEKLIERRTGADCKLIVEKLVKIALYDPDKKITVVNKETGEEVETKRRGHFYTSSVQLQALQLLMAYYYGRPKEKVEVDKIVNINIEKKVGIITKLISENKDRLKLVDGGVR